MISWRATVRSGWLRHQPQAQESETARALGCIAGAVLCYAIVDALAKMFTAQYGVAQILFLRTFFSLLILVPMLWREGGLSALRTTRPGLHLLRGLIGTTALWLFIYAFSYMRLSDVVAIAYASPLFVALYGRVLLREPAHPGANIALVIGFLGSGLILGPSVEILQWKALLPFAAALLLSVYIAMIKLAPRREPASVAFFYVTMVGLVTSGLAACAAWRPIEMAALPLFAISGVIAGMALLLRNAGYRRASLAVVAPVEYSGIAWASLFGFLWFGEKPSEWFLPGVTLLVLGNLLLLSARPLERTHH